jgi:hypothetical protein
VTVPEKYSIIASIYFVRSQQITLYTAEEVVIILFW